MLVEFSGRDIYTLIRSLQSELGDCIIRTRVELMIECGSFGCFEGRFWVVILVPAGYWMTAQGGGYLIAIHLYWVF